METVIKPTRIVKDLGLRPSDKGTKFMVRWFKCDDGREYTVDGLAKATGLAVSTIYNRMSAQGCESEGILVNNRTKSRSRTAVFLETRREKLARPCPEQEAWATLGTRARVENFRRISPPGTFERLGLV